MLFKLQWAIRLFSFGLLNVPSGYACVGLTCEKPMARCKRKSNRRPPSVSAASLRDS